MFITPRPKLYESTEGFSVEVLGQTGLAYREGDHEMFVDSEVLPGPTGMGIYRSSVRQWSPPHDRKVVTNQVRERIINNIREAFRFQGFEIDVI